MGDLQGAGHPLELSGWRANVWRHVFVYFWLSFGLFLAVLHSQASIRPVLSLVLIAALGAWYWRWQVMGESPGAGGNGAQAATASGTWGNLSPDQVYLLGGILIWASLIFLDQSFVFAGVAVLAPYCFGSVRWALLSLVPCIGSWLWQEAVTSGLDWEELVIAITAVGSGVLLSGYIGSLTRQNVERQRLIDQLRSAQADLAAAERRAGMLAERHRLARDIHDTLTQGFASIVMLLEAAKAEPSSPQAARHTDAALRSARDNLAESRRLVWALRPEALADGQLGDAIGQLLDRLQEETGVQAELVVTGTPRDLGRQAETSLLRLAQEALANVRKHARARRTTVTLSYMEDVTVVDVQDDGVGFEPSPSLANGNGRGPGGLGLRAMRERAEELGGHLAVEAAPGEGTTIVAEIPIQPGPAEPAPLPEASAAGASEPGTGA